MKYIAFDLDGTLIDQKNNPRYEVLWLLFWFKQQEWDIIVWSGGGVDYAETMVNRLGLTDMVRVIPKFSEKVDIAVDDAIGVSERKALGDKAKVVIQV